MNNDKNFKRQFNPSKFWVLMAVSLLVLITAACNMPGESVEQVELPELGDPHAGLYRMIFVGETGELEVRKFIGQLRMVDYEALFGDVELLPVDENGNHVGGPKLVDDLEFSMIVTPSGLGMKLMSIDLDGTLSTTFDLDEDRVVDIGDLILEDGQRISFVTEGLGREIFEGLILGKNPLCAPEIIHSFGLDEFPGCDRDTGGGSSGGAFPGGWGIYDPWGELCSQSGISPIDSIKSRYIHADVRVFSTTDYVEQHEGSGHVRASTTVFVDENGEHIATVRNIRYYNSDGELTRTIVEKVDSNGNGVRTIQDHNPKGTDPPPRHEKFNAQMQRNGTYLNSDSNPPARSREAEEREGQPPEAPESPSEGIPGSPEDDTSWIERLCSRNFVSGVEQATEEDPSVFNVSCGDLIDAPGNENCIIMEWAGAGDFDDALHPSEDDGCDNFQDPGAGGICEPATIAERFRGLTAMFASLNIPDMMVCSPVVCREPDSLGAEVPLSGESPTEPIMGTIPNTVPCYWGPGSTFGTVSSLQSGISVPIVGIGEQEGWLVVGNPIYENVACWVLENYVDVPADLDLTNLPDVEIPTSLMGNQGDGDGGQDDSGGSCELSVAVCSSQGLSFDSTNCKCVLIE